jgi:hypothetical protein
MPRMAVKRPKATSLPYMFPYILPLSHAMWLQVADLNGGRGRTRTCDLLRVKPAACFFWLHGILHVLWFFNNMGSLLFAQRQVPWFERMVF